MLKQVAFLFLFITLASCRGGSYYGHGTRAPCNNTEATCPKDGCESASCPAYPYAVCQSDPCGNCSANFVFNYTLTIGMHYSESWKMNVTRWCMTRPRYCRNISNIDTNNVCVDPLCQGDDFVSMMSTGVRNYWEYIRRYYYGRRGKRSGYYGYRSRGCQHQGGNPNDKCDDLGKTCIKVTDNWEACV